MSAAYVDSIVAELAAEFGPGHSNGVVAILVHPDLPEQFGRDHWADWTFRPAEAAFEWAATHGLIIACEQAGEWAFTQLGRAVAQKFRADGCPGHIASSADPKVCAHCGTHVDEERPPNEEDERP